MNEELTVKGRLSWKHVRNGEVIAAAERDNVITTAGKNALATLLTSAAAGTSLVTHMGFGTASAPVNVADAALGTELSGNGYGRVAVARSNPSGNVVQYTATLTGLSAEVTVEEAGLFDADTGGTLFAHQLTGPVTLSSASDSLQVTWQVTVS
ncbi:hypothetical protein M6D81_11565 [Paenibacillus sp. J5C_2022]|uniref:hypothetical protein n=1 Tax=Paenibacillus sp. J5C2022 TaxID=2977129 RepID=UPI0021D1FD99|nr:hypothetical protein [Paenibacillus sp. J5C2022]MCU6709345.1 hypothetical protein [Paenibacillus sp. J5C2022]